MKKRFLTVGLILTLASSMMFTSCIGSFGLTNKVLSWNQQVGSKFTNALIFAAFCVIPVYELTVMADILIINSIEFWSGSNPVTASAEIIDGENARYLVERNSNGYIITNTNDNSVVKFNFDSNNNSWSLEQNGTTYPLMQFVDDNHVKMITPNNTYQTIELSHEGVLAYQDIINSNLFAMAQ